MHDPSGLLRGRYVVEETDEDMRVLRCVIHPGGGAEPVEIMRATYSRAR